MKMLLFSDLHYRESRIEDCEMVLDEIKRIAKFREVDSIINCGDTFNDKGIVRTACLSSYFKKRAEFFDIDWVDIVGNHDQEDADGKIHALSSFGLFSGAHVVENYRIAGNILIVAYKKDLKEFLSSLSKDYDWSKITLICHAGIAGASMNESKVDTDGLPRSLTKKFKRVISGHYHMPHEFDNVIYVGSPMQQDFGEIGQKKSVVIYDTKKDTWIRDEIKGLPKHYIVSVRWVDGEIEMKVPKRITKRDFVKVDMKGEIEQVRAMPRSKFDEIECRTLKIESEIAEVYISRLGITTEELDNETLLVEKYVEFLNPDLDKKKLMHIYRDLKEA